MHTIECHVYTTYLSTRNLNITNCDQNVAILLDDVTLTYRDMQYLNNNIITNRDQLQYVYSYIYYYGIVDNVTCTHTILIIEIIAIII